MSTAEVREYLIDMHQKKLPSLIERDLVVPLDSGKIISIIGPRRAGKTFFLFQTMGRFLTQGVLREQILYLNFEDPRLIDVTYKEMRDIIKLYWLLYPSSLKRSLYLFIDEPQMISQWEVAVRALHDEGFILFVTGSSSKLLSKEIATSLRGRTLSYVLLPFSFKEFLKVKQALFSFNTLSSQEKALLLSLVEEYLEFGGFPEIIQQAEAVVKVKLLDEYFRLITYRDVVERYNIKNTKIIQFLIKSLITSFSKEFSVHKIYLSLRSQGIKVSKNTLYHYLSLLQDSFFVFLLLKSTGSFKKREFSIPKAYLVDTGFRKLLETDKDIGRKLENAVLVELQRRMQPATELSYWKNVSQEEVDFVLINRGRVEQLLQVCSDVSDREVKKREVRALLKASEEHKSAQLRVITFDYEGEEEVSDKKIYYIPFWKWCLF